MPPLKGKRSFSSRLFGSEKERAFWISVSGPVSASSDGQYCELWRSNVIGLPAAPAATGDAVVMTTPCDVGALAVAALAAIGQAPNPAGGGVAHANPSFVVALHLGAQGPAASITLEVEGGGGSCSTRTAPAPAPAPAPASVVARTARSRVRGLFASRRRTPGRRVHHNHA